MFTTSQMVSEMLESVCNSVFIGMLPSYNLGTKDGFSALSDSTPINVHKYLFKIVNGGLFET